MATVTRRENKVILVDANIPKNYREAIEYLQSNYAVRFYDCIYRNLEDAIEDSNK